MKHPDRCRNNLVEAYPRSGCEECSRSALANCPYENIDGYIHECLDRLSVSMSHIDNFVLHHRGMK